MTEQNAYLFRTYIQPNMASLDRAFYRRIEGEKYHSRTILPLVQSVFPNAAFSSGGAGPEATTTMASNASRMFGGTRAACISACTGDTPSWSPSAKTESVAVGFGSGYAALCDSDGNELHVARARPERRVTAVLALPGHFLLLGRHNGTLRLFHRDKQVGDELRLGHGRIHKVELCAD